MLSMIPLAMQFFSLRADLKQSEVNREKLVINPERNSSACAVSNILRFQAMYLLMQYIIAVKLDRPLHYCLFLRPTRRGDFW